MKKVFFKKGEGIITRFAIILFVYVCINCINIKDANAYDRNSDSLALVAFYNAQLGVMWNDNTNWLSSSPIPQWYGVEVTNNRVTSLDLYDNNLDGIYIPDCIGNLTALEYLDLGYNNFEGTLPSFLVNLTSLEYLFLGGNDFEGSIPSSYSNLTNLKMFYIENNRLSGEIPSFFSNLEGYNVMNNQFIFSDFVNIMETLNNDGSFYGGGVAVTVGLQTSLSLPFGSELYIPGYTPYTGDVFQWYRNGTPVEGNHVDSFDGGTYNCVVTNPAFSQSIVLFSRNFYGNCYQSI